MDLDRLFYIESDEEYSDQGMIDRLIMECKDIGISGNMWSILEVPANMDRDDLVEKIQETSDGHAGQIAAPVYMVGALDDSEVAERLFDHYNSETTNNPVDFTKYLVLDENNENAENGAVIFDGGLAFYCDDVNGYTTMLRKDFDNLNLVKG